MSKQLFTVGHSNLALADFIDLINRHQVNAIADVRSYPYSSYSPHFNQDLLKFELLKAKIKYAFLGEQLGARPKDLSCYINGRAVYTKIASSNDFQAGIERILVGLDRYKIALMCSEKDPISCHRTILICRHLRQQNLKINHIIDRNNIESQEQLEDRLADLYGFDLESNQLKVPEVLQFDLFGSVQQKKTFSVSKTELLERAYLLQERKIAYKKQ